jgi:hypothetical protein
MQNSMIFPTISGPYVVDPGFISRNQAVMGDRDLPSSYTAETKDKLHRKFK